MIRPQSSFNQQVRSRVGHHLNQLARRRLLSILPKGATCAELGVWRGDFSARILSHLNPRELHLVDPWVWRTESDYHNAIYGARNTGGQAALDSLADSVRVRFQSEIEDGIVTIHRTEAVEAAENFMDGYFDWVYLDADHTYPIVAADLAAYTPKIKIDGLIVGDDYGAPGWWDDGVTRAVDESVATGQLELEKVIGRQFLLRRTR